MENFSYKSLFKLYLAGFGGFFAVFCLICGVLALFGAETVYVYDQAQTGAAGLISAVVMFFAFTLFLSVFMWLITSFGLWVYSFFKPLNFFSSDV